MKEQLAGLTIAINGNTEIHLVLSLNCFNFGFELFPGTFRLNVGPLAFIVERF